MRNIIVVAAVTAVLGLGAAIPAVAASTPAPVGPTGTGPSTSVAGHYALITPEGRQLAPAFAPAADDVTFTLPAYWTVVVWGEGSSCVVPDTREQHNGADDQPAFCRSVPEVQPGWARSAAVRPGGR